MAQKYCTVCGKPVSDQDQVCPNCGAWNLGQKNTDTTTNTVKASDVSLKRILLPLLALIAIVAFVMVVPITKDGIGANAVASDSISQANENTEDEVNTEDSAAEEKESAVSEDEEEPEEKPQEGKAPPQYPSVSGTYKGEIKTPTVIRLKQEANYIFGTIRYTKFDSPALDISGTIEPNGNFELKEYDENRKQSGRITGTIKGNTMSGKFYNPQRDTTTPFELTRE